MMTGDLKPVVLLSAPYILPFKERFAPVFEHYGLKVDHTRSG